MMKQTFLYGFGLAGSTKWLLISEHGVSELTQIFRYEINQKDFFEQSDGFWVVRSVDCFLLERLKQQIEQNNFQVDLRGLNLLELTHYRFKWNSERTLLEVTTIWRGWAGDQPAEEVVSARLIHPHVISFCTGDPSRPVRWMIEEQWGKSVIGS